MLPRWYKEGKILSRKRERKTAGGQYRKTLGRWHKSCHRRGNETKNHRRQSGKMNEWHGWLPCDPLPHPWSVEEWGFSWARCTFREEREREKEIHVVERGRMREDSEWERLVQVRAIYSLNLGFYSRVGWWFKNNIKEFQLMFGSYFRNLVFKSMNFLGRGNQNSNFLNFFFSSVLKLWKISVCQS